MSFRLVLITPPGPPTPQEVELAQQLVKRGMHTLHVRKPGSGREQVAEYLAALSPDTRRRTMLHSHHDLAKTTSIGGIHYREEDRPPGVIKAPPGLAGMCQGVSTSFHALPDLSVCRGELDYAFLSPIYPSISKPGHEADFQPEELASALAGSRHPIMALGGVTPERFGELAELGFAGAALLGAVWQASDPLEAWERALRQADAVGG